MSRSSPWFEFDIIRSMYATIKQKRFGWRLVWPHHNYESAFINGKQSHGADGAAHARLLVFGFHQIGQGATDNLMFVESALDFFHHSNRYAIDFD